MLKKLLLPLGIISALAYMDNANAENYGSWSEGHKVIFSISSPSNVCSLVPDYTNSNTSNVHYADIVDGDSVNFYNISAVTGDNSPPITDICFTNDMSLTPPINKLSIEIHNKYCGNNAPQLFYFWHDSKGNPTTLYEFPLDQSLMQHNPAQDPETQWQITQYAGTDSDPLHGFFQFNRKDGDQFPLTLEVSCKTSKPFVMAAINFTKRLEPDATISS